MSSILGSYSDAGDGMEFHPLSMKGVLDVSSDDGYVRSGGRKSDVIGIVGAGSLGVGLRNRILTHDFEDEVAVLRPYIPGVQKILKFGIHLKPAVGVSVRLVTDAIRFLARSGIDNRAASCDALLMHDQARDDKREPRGWDRTWWLPAAWAGEWGAAAEKQAQE